MCFAWIRQSELSGLGQSRGCPLIRALLHGRSAGSANGPAFSSRVAGTPWAVRQRFKDGFTDDDWDHTVGGVNVLAVDNGIVAHAAVDERLLMAADRALRTGYVEGVATAANHRRRGYASIVMRQVGGIIRKSYEA